jgi:hypothetical protein
MGKEGKHQAGFKPAPMEPLAAFRLGNNFQHPLGTAPEEPRQKRQLGQLLLDFTGSHLEQSNLTAMAIKKNQALKTSARCHSSQGLELGQQRFRT